MVFKHRLRLAEVPVSCASGGRTSSIGGIWSVYYAIKVLLARLNRALPPKRNAARGGAE